MIRRFGKATIFLISAVILGQLAPALPAAAQAAMAMDHMTCGQNHQIHNHQIQNHLQNHQAHTPPHSVPGPSDLCCDPADAALPGPAAGPTADPGAAPADMTCLDACMTFCIALQAALPLTDSAAQTFAVPATPRRPDMEDPTAHFSDFVSPPPKA